MFEENDIVVIRKDNKNTYIRVKEDLKIYVYTNRWTKDKEIKKLIEDNHKYIEKMLDRQNRKVIENTKNYLLGREIDVVVLSTQDKPEIYNNKLYVKDRSKINKYYKEIASEIFKERLDYIYSKFDENIPYPKLKIRHMTSRWGVCNRKDMSITLNLELIKKDIKYLDYVIIHELCHFIEFNHSTKFWNSVEKYCKDYKFLRKEMKE